MNYVPPLDGSGNDPYVDSDLDETPPELGSLIPGAAVERTMRETVNAISRSGQTPSAGDLNQLSKAIVGFEAVLTDAGTIAWDLAAAPNAVVTLGGNRTLGNPTNMQAGGTYKLIVKQDGTGGRTLAYGSAYAFPGGTPPTITATANRVDVLTFEAHGGKMLGRFSQNYTL
jgi:hypothetical protein